MGWALREVDIVPLNLLHIEQKLISDFIHKTTWVRNPSNSFGQLTLLSTLLNSPIIWAMIAEWLAFISCLSSKKSQPIMESNIYFTIPSVVCCFRYSGYRRSPFPSNPLSCYLTILTEDLRFIPVCSDYWLCGFSDTETMTLTVWIWDKRYQYPDH